MSFNIKQVENIASKLAQFFYLTVVYILIKC